MNLLIWGVNGRMGQLIYQTATQESCWQSVQGIDRDKPVEEISIKPDVVVDFSHVSSTYEVINYCVSNNVPLVMGTTGHDEKQLEAIKRAAQQIPILKSTNMSMGMNVIFLLVEQIAAILKDRVDIEIVEAHHNGKKDAPSGSAITIVEAIEKGLGRKVKRIYGRSGESPRQDNEIGIHSLRGGNMVGYHEAYFINHLETLKISHEAYNPTVFALGALEAARYLLDKPNGIYNMKDVLRLD